MIELGTCVISLQLVTPYPDIDVPIDPATYQVTLVVERGTVAVMNGAWGLVKALYR